MIDTCKAESLFDDIESPNLVLMGSSNRTEDGLSHQNDSFLNVVLSDHFSYFL